MNEASLNEHDKLFSVCKLGQGNGHWCNYIARIKGEFSYIKMCLFVDDLTWCED